MFSLDLSEVTEEFFLPYVIILLSQHVGVKFNHNNALYRWNRLQAICNGSVSVLSTSKMKTIFLLTLDFAAEATRCREWFHVYRRVAINIRWKL